jgi:acyl carrier protein
MQVGMAAAQATRAERHRYRAIQSFEPEQGLAVLRALLCGRATHVGVMPFRLRRWFEYFRASAGWGLLSQLTAEEPEREETGRGESALRAELEALASPEARAARLGAHLREQLAQVLGTEPERIDPRQPLTELGLDSLMAVELKNRLETSFGVALDATLVFRHPTLERIGPALAREMELDVATGFCSEAARDDTVLGEDEPLIERILGAANELSTGALREARASDGETQR